jgi:ribosomal protein S12 methylthiotransferase accessory factor
MELYHAEHVALPVLEGSYDDMARRGAVMALEDLPLTRYSVFSRQWREHWVVGRNLMSGDEIAVPFALVALWDAAHAGPDNLRSFQISSNGLASGNDLAEAIVSALLEVVERDAVTCHKLVEHMMQQPPERVRLETISGPLVCDLISRLHDSGVTVLIHDCSTDVGVPVYACHLYEVESRQVGASLGYGAHPDPEIAMLRAVTEAAQSRLVAIAGSRDDIFRRGLHRIRSASSHAQIESLARFPASVDASELVSEATETFEGDIDLLLARLQQVGLNQVIVFDLSRPDFPFSVVRVVVPGLEGHMFEYYTPGRRALALSHTRKREAA